MHYVGRMMGLLFVGNAFCIIRISAFSTKLILPNMYNTCYASIAKVGALPRPSLEMIKKLWTREAESPALAASSEGPLLVPTLRLLLPPCRVGVRVRSRTF